jgi:hypothetical protein
VGLDQLPGRPVCWFRQPGDEVLAVLGDRGLVLFADRVDQPGPGREVIGDRRPVVLTGGGDYLAVRHSEPAGGEQLLGGRQQAQPSFGRPARTGDARLPRSDRREVSHIFGHYAQTRTSTYISS